jgi:hypothetical protein
MSGATGSAFLDLEWLRICHRPELSETPEDKAIDVADCIVSQSLDMAQHVIGHSPDVRGHVFRLAEMHSRLAIEAYKSHALVAALQGISAAVKSASDDSATVLETALGNVDSSLEGLSSQLTYSGKLLNERFRGIEVTLDALLSELRNRPT